MKEISLALGGGGIRGIAHIGVIRSLEKMGYKISAIAGTSAGSLVGAIYAAGQTTYQIESLLTHLNRNQLFKRNPKDGPSLLGLNGVKRSLSPILEGLDFSELKINFACTAVDIQSAKEIVFTSKNVMKAVQASIAVPGIFPPIVHKNYLLVDGGLIDPVPVAIAKWLAPDLPIVAVCLSAKQAPIESISPFPPLIPLIPANFLDYFSKMRIGQAFNIFYQSMDTGSSMIAELRMEKEKPDIIIRPRVGHYHILDDIDKAEDLIRSGEIAVEEKKEELQQMHSSYKRFWRQLKLRRLPQNVSLFEG